MWVALLALALIIRLLTAWLLRQPGYTDAYYYATGARQLALGHGFVEPFIWNYLDPPEGVVHPGYLYWMPLAAILGWLGTVAVGASFRAIQAPFVLISALLPLIAYRVALDLNLSTLGGARLDRRRYALLAGLLGIVPGFYTHVLVLPDNFAPFALAGGVCLWAAGRGKREGAPAWFAGAGIAAGFGHLSRADGLLLLGVALAAALLQSSRTDNPRPRLLSFASCLLGYLVVMSPWFTRNWLVSGALLPGGGLQTLFLTTYDDMFAYNRAPTLDSYLAWGWADILYSKLLAAGQNVMRLWIENFAIVLLPFSVLGLWRLRHDPLLWPFLIYFPILFVAMTLAFTFPGTRGGLYHSGGALLPFILATSGPGLTVAVRWAARRLRGWHAQRAWQVFAAGLVATAATVATFALWRAGAFDGTWNRRDAHYQAVAEWIESQGVVDPVVMVGDAPAFVWHTGMKAVAVPNEPLGTVATVAGRYRAAYLLLDDTRPRTTDALYRREYDDLRFELVFHDGNTQLYIIQQITPVNTFRLIFHHYLGADLERMENRSYFSTWTRPYRFIDVTEDVRSSRHPNTSESQ